jgi:TRAP-type C4-dicarboxylate transport system substrate-binding protein
MKKEKIKMKKILSMILTLVMVLSLAACGESGDTTTPPADGSNPDAAPSGEVQQLTFAHVLDAEHPVHLGAVYFADRLEELSGGTMVTTVHPNSALGGEDEVTEMQSYSDSVTFSAPSGCVLQNYTGAAYVRRYYPICLSDRPADLRPAHYGLYRRRDSDRGSVFRSAGAELRV